MKRGALPLNALRAFESAARLGRMTAAAEELGVTHGAISRHVRELERIVGASLFEGPRNRQRPTPRAREILSDLRTAFDTLESAVSRIMGDESRSLDVSCLGTLTMRWLIPRLYDFQERHPGIDVRLTSSDGPLSRGPRSPDVAIRVGVGPWVGWEVIPLFEERVGPVASPVLVEATSDILRDAPKLHTKTRPDAWTDWAASEGRTLSSSGRTFEHFYFMLEAATAGLGVAVAPEVLVRDDLAAGRLVATNGFRASGNRYVVLLPETPKPEARVFAEWVRATSV